VNITIKDNLRKRRQATARLRPRLQALLSRSGLAECELSVLLVGDRAMRGLNRVWRGIDRTTDVLSFSQREGRFSEIRPELLGDIVICVPQAERQAADAGHSLARELERLLVHGLVHILGYDHERGPAEAARMRRKERQFLERLEKGISA
jgi:probable rRNA maturation factor